MTDTKLLNWLQENATAFRQLTSEEYELSWLDYDACEHKTLGRDLRDCIRGAIVGETQE
jgi:hypothetical protein